jgi:hypothetical protein
MKKRIPVKRDRGISKELICSIVSTYCEDSHKYWVKLVPYFLTKYCGYSLRKAAVELGISKTNVVYHIQSVSHYKKKDIEFADMYSGIEKTILFKTNGVRKRIIYHKYNNRCQTSPKVNPQPNTTSLTLKVRQRKMHTILSSKRKRNK